MSSFSIQLLKGINEISEKSWDMQLPPCKNPFLSWRFLHACEESGSSSPNTGWTPKHLILRDNNKNHIFVELKNKHNTMNDASSTETFNKMKRKTTWEFAYF